MSKFGTLLLCTGIQDVITDYIPNLDTRIADSIYSLDTRACSTGKFNKPSFVSG